MSKKPDQDKVVSIDDYRRIWSVGFLYCTSCKQENVYAWKKMDKHIKCKICSSQIPTPNK